MQDVMLQLKEKWGDDVLTTGSFIYGLPGETKESLKEYERWLVEDSLNYFDFVSLFPLHISLNEKIKNDFKSEIAINFSKYGYVKDNNETKKNYNWISEEMGIDYIQAHKIVDIIVNIMKNDDRFKLGGSGLGAIGYRNVGATYNDLKNIPYKELIKNNFVIKNFINKIIQYKQNIIYG
jgi:coproporphyrinogen III oxidase-like Fe-S oxidoreductase